MKTNQPSGLIKNSRIIPQKISDLSNISKNKIPKKNNSKFENQTANIKISQETKNNIAILMNLTNTKFTYEMIQEMIKTYISYELSYDQQRAFKTLNNLNS